MNITVVTPVFNDWPSFRRLLADLDATAQRIDAKLRVVAVDDASSQDAEFDETWLAPHPRVEQLEVVRLACNLGHQRAIAVGLVVALEGDAVDLVVVMDSDGEDNPADLERLIAVKQDSGDDVVVARRAERSEGRKFQMGYSAYKSMFRLLTGQTIDFGNYCLLAPSVVRQLVHDSNLWNHLAATLVRSRFKMQRVDTVRATRYAGASSMNTVSLVTHGLSAMAVFAESCIVRMMILLGALVPLLIAAMALVTGIRIFSEDAVPGWATTAVGILAVIMMQTVLLTLMSAFLVLSARGRVQVIPVIDAGRFIASRTRLGQEAERSA